MDIKLKHDREADAVYVQLKSRSYSYGRDLDDMRRIDYDSNNVPIGVELLGVSKGVNVDRLPFKYEIAEALEAKEIKVYEMKEHAEIWQNYSTVIIYANPNSPVKINAEGHKVELVKEEATA